MKIKSLFSALLILTLSAGALLGQSNVKIGYTDPEYLLGQLPEYKQIESELKSYEKQLQTQIDGKMKEYQGKLEAYQQMVSNPSGTPDVVRQDKEKELLGMQSSIKEFEETALSSLQKKQAALLDPVIQKVGKAIEEVAKENGYTYIFNVSAGNNVALVLYAKNKDEDISDLVLKKLGVTAAPKTEPGTTGSGTTNGTNTSGTSTTVAPKTGTGSGTGTGTGSGSGSTAPIKKK